MALIGLQAGGRDARHRLRALRHGRAGQPGGEGALHVRRPGPRAAGGARCRSASGRASAAQHSQSLEAWFAHMPGLVVVAPATPADNYALLAGGASRCGDPVVYMEHKELWGLEGEVPQGHRVALGAAAVAPRGARRDAGHLVAHGAHGARGRGGRRPAGPVGRSDRPAHASGPGTARPCSRRRPRRGACWSPTRRSQAAGSAPRSPRRWPRRCSIPVRRLGAPRVPVGYSRPLEDEARITPDKILAQVVALCEAGGRERSAAPR